MSDDPEKPIRRPNEKVNFCVYEASTGRVLRIGHLSYRHLASQAVDDSEVVMEIPRLNFPERYHPDKFVVDLTTRTIKPISLQ